MTTEKVLCIPCEQIRPEFLQPETAIQISDLNHILSDFISTEFKWIAREIAETDERNLQIVSYMIITDADLNIATYARRGTEARLHGMRSLGIGGHVNPCDERLAGGEFDFFMTVMTALAREQMEELPDSIEGETRLLGVIHESKTDVGKVHLGFVFHHQAHAESSEIHHGDLDDLRWMCQEELQTMEHFEIWSKLAYSLYCKA